MQYPTANPCPFCGSVLKPQFNQKRTEVIAYAHPPGECFVGGHNIGVKLLPKWNERAKDPLILFLTSSLGQVLIKQAVGGD